MILRPACCAPPCIDVQKCALCGRLGRDDELATASQDHSSSPKITERIQATMTVATSPRAIVICTVKRSAARSAGACSCSRSQCYVQPEQERTLRSFRQNFRFACLDCPKNSSESLDSCPAFCSRVSTASILLIALSIFYADKRQARPGQRPARSGQI